MDDVRVMADEEHESEEDHPKYGKSNQGGDKFQDAGVLKGAGGFLFFGFHEHGEFFVHG